MPSAGRRAPRRRSSTRRECADRFGLGLEAWKKHLPVGDPLRHLRAEAALRSDGARLDRKRLYAEAYDRLVAGESVESLGLPNLGLPEPVPTVDDRHLPLTSRSNPP